MAAQGGRATHNIYAPAIRRISTNLVGWLTHPVNGFYDLASPTSMQDGVTKRILRGCYTLYWLSILVYSLYSAVLSSVIYELSVCLLFRDEGVEW